MRKINGNGKMRLEENVRRFSVDKDYVRNTLKPMAEEKILVYEKSKYFNYGGLDKVMFDIFEQVHNMVILDINLSRNNKKIIFKGYDGKLAVDGNVYSANGFINKPAECEVTGFDGGTTTATLIWNAVNIVNERRTKHLYANLMADKPVKKYKDVKKLVTKFSTKKYDANCSF